MISAEQERQMTTLFDENIHPVCVENCKDGGDDLDLVVAKLFANPELKTQLNLSSVNSINWCRVMVQAVHHAYGYFKACDRVGDRVSISVPSGAYGNLFAGFLAREMGIPIHTFICANNRNNTLHTAFSTGVFKKLDLCQTLSSAIDIVVPYNFWRFLYFSSGCDATRINQWMKTFDQKGEICLDKQMTAAIQQGYASCTISDQITLDTIQSIWTNNHYLLDPHGAVAVAAAMALGFDKKPKMKTICLATAHPAKFPKVIQKALGRETLPGAARHPFLIRDLSLDQKRILCHHDNLEATLVSAMLKNKKNNR
jgi:threonine synthase